jgi:hypothetical protein
MRRTREDWKRLIAEFRTSGMGTTEFARKRRINPKTFQWWAWELRDKSLAESVKFVPVQTAAAVVPTRDVVEARVGAVTLRFESGTDVEYVSELLGRLGAAC